jgi:acetyl-CoA C-acetyltransferase
MTDREVFVIGARRTPIGRVGGRLRSLRVDTLAAACLRGLLDDTGARPAEVDEVVLGNVWGPGGNPARLAALDAGLGVETPGLTIDAQCASGLAAINLAARAIAAGSAELCLAGGAESASTAPWRVARPTGPAGLPTFQTRARFAPDGLPDPDMGPAADALAHEYGITRLRQDTFAADSHRKAVASQTAGRFDEELVAVRDDDPRPHDESPRARFTLRALQRLQPMYGEHGTVTVGTTAPINDAAAVVAVASRAMCERLGVRPELQLVEGITAGVDPRLPGAGPIAAVRELLARRKLGADDVDVVEFTEAFAGQTLACLDALDLDPARVNLGGGAIALGHPWGASGAVLVTRLFSEMVRRPEGPTPPRRGLAALAGAGGLGVATLLERRS